MRVHLALACLLIPLSVQAQDESNMFEISASCAMLAEIKGQRQTALEHVKIATLVLDKQEVAFWSGRASGIVDIVSATTKKPRKIVAQHMYKNMNCIKILTKES